MSRQSYTLLGLEAFEERLCLNSALVSLISTVETVKSVDGLLHLSDSFKAGQNAANGLIQYVAGNSDLGHVIVDATLTAGTLYGGYLAASEAAVSTEAKAILTSEAGGAVPEFGKLVGALETAAFAIGAAAAVEQDFIVHGTKVLNQIQALGAGALQQVINDVKALDNSVGYYAGKFAGTLGQAVGDFAVPPQPPAQVQLSTPAYSNSSPSSNDGQSITYDENAPKAH